MKLIIKDTALTPENLCIENDHLRNLTIMVVKNRARSSSHHFINEIIGKFQIAGFKNGTKAPAHLLANSFLQNIAADDSGKLLRIILTAWAELNCEMESAARAAFSGNDSSTLQSFAERQCVGAVCRQTDFEALFVTRPEEYDRNDLALMIKLMFDIVPIDDEEFNILSENNPDALTTASERYRPSALLDHEWQLMFTPWRDLPPESPLWDSLDDFISQLQQLGAEKRTQRAVYLPQLERHLDVLHQHPRLRFFGFEDAATWTASGLSDVQAGQIVELVADLISHIEQYDALYMQRGETLTDESERYRQLEALVVDIEALRNTLQRTFGTPQPEPPSDPDRTDSQSTEEISESAAVTPQTQEVGQGTDINESSITDNSAAPLMYKAGETELQSEMKMFAAVPLRTIDLESAEAPANVVETEAEIMHDDEIRQSIVSTASDQADSSLPCETFWPAEVALYSLSEQRDRQDEFFWGLIAAGDFSGAYWLARNLEAQQITAPLSSRFLRMIYGASIVSSDMSHITLDLAAQIREDFIDLNNPIMRLLAIGAALRAVLIAPNSGLIAWLSDIDPFLNNLRNVIKPIKDFSVYQIAVQPEYLTEQTREQRQQMIVQAAENVRRLLEQAPQQRNKFQRASVVWRNLVSSNGALYKALKPAADNAQQHVEDVRARLKGEWLNEDALDATIDQVDRPLIGAKTRPITGDALRQLKRDIRDLCESGLRWCEAVERSQIMDREDNWIMKQVENLRSQVSSALTAVAEECALYLTPENNRAQRATCYAVGYLLRNLQDTLALQQPHLWWHDAPVSTWELPHTPPNAPTLLTATLDHRLGRRLIWMPESKPDDISLHAQQETLEQPAIIEGLLRSYADGRSAENAARQWHQQEDYRFIEWLYDADNMPVSEVYENAILGSRLKLKTRLERTKSDIERAVIDGILTAEKRASMLRKAEAIDPMSTLAFGPAGDLLEGISYELKALRQNRLDALAERWQEFRIRYQSQIQPNNWQLIEESIQQAFDCEDSRVVEEALYQLDRVNEDGEEAVVRVFEGGQATSALAEFLEREESFFHALEPQGVRVLWDALSQKNSFAGLQWQANRIPTPFKGQVKEVLRTWNNLKPSQRDRAVNSKALYSDIQQILALVGFTFASNDSGFSDVRQGRDWTAMQINMTANETLVRPIPQFGTLTHGRYDVLCVWDRPNADTLGALLHDQRSENRSTVVIYLGRLTPPRRRQMMQITRERELQIVILDEVLLTYVIYRGIKQAPLPVFMQCALPFSTVNPYTPYRAGDVPPELFYGRQDMALELQRDSGTCLVYGGRQLGKSALLRHVERRFHAPEREQISWVEDIKQLGDPLVGYATNELWSRLRDGFRRFGLLTEKTTTGRLEDIPKSLTDVMHKNPKLRVLILFDEADNFLETDAENGFKVVDRLRKLMADTGRRFKVVFAGLHNVQRFKDIPNQPLAHFGTALCVGPLEPIDALKLIEEPLATLGFKIERETALRILSYTNYHPGLIQLFCYELLKLLFSKPVSRNHLPVSVARQDVEAVYLQSDVKNEIRNRFNWTLALDTRYQVIAWALIENQLAIHDSYARLYSAREIQRLVMGWWRQGFEGVEIKALLNEMKGLGVLVEQDGLYQLRSPNLVRLVGEDQAEQNLLELDDQDVPTSRLDQNHHHALLDETRHIYSPLTYAQERSLNTEYSSVSLVFAAPLSGLETLDTVLRRLLAAELGESGRSYVTLAQSVRDGSTITDALDRILKHYHQARQLVAVYFVPEDMTPAQLQDIVEVALKFCKRLETKRPEKVSLRVIFVCNPQATWSWANIDPQYREVLLRRANAISAAPWSLNGLKQRLEREDFNTAARELTQKVHDVTGGWHMQLHAVFNQFYKQQHQADISMRIRSLAQEADALLNNQNDRDLQSQCGLMSLPVVGAVLRFIVQNCGEQGLDIDLIVPEMIDDPRVSTLAQCQIALTVLEHLQYVRIQRDDKEHVFVDNALLKRVFA